MCNCLWRQAALLKRQLHVIAIVKVWLNVVRICGTVKERSSCVSMLFSWTCCDVCGVGSSCIQVFLNCIYVVQSLKGYLMSVCCFLGTCPVYGVDSPAAGVYKCYLCSTVQERSYVYMLFPCCMLWCCMQGR